MLLSLVTFSALAGLQAYGADTQWTGGVSSDWGTANNWATLAVPLPAESVLFGTLGTRASAVLGAPFTQAGLTFVADVTTTISGAALTLDDGGVKTTPITVAGTHTISAPLMIPSGATLAEPDSLSQLTLSGGLSGGDLIKSGPGTLAFNGGSSSLLSLQDNGGTVTVAPGTALSLTSTGDSLGLRDNTAKLLMSGGTLDLSGRWRLANDGSVGIATITGGTITHTGSYVDVGFNQGMAVLTFGGTAIYQGAGRDLQMSVANYCNTYSVFKDNAIAEFGGLNINFTNGGANQYGMINVSDSASLTGSSMAVGVDQNQSNSNVSVATVNQTGGTVTVNGIVKLAGNNQQLSPIAGTTGLQGTYNLAGGTLTTQQVLGGGAGVGGQARLNFHGGTLAINASASTGQAASFVSLTDNGTDGKAYVYQNSTIATGSQTVTIGQPLLAPTGQGVASIALSAAGSGYNVPPAVRITRAVGDTTGTGATARAEVNPATGALTGITITNPGTDYTLPPAVELDRGNGSGAVVATLSNQLVNTGSLGAAANTVRFDGLAGQAGALAGDANPAFTTTQQIVKVPYSAALNPNGSFTIEAWLKPASITAGNFTCALSSGQFGSPRSGWLIYQDQANGWNFRTYAQDGTNAATNIEAFVAVAVGTWYHVVASWDGSMSRIYLNGVLQATSPSATFVPSAGGDMNFGSRADNAFLWDGSIDEVAFYPTALSDTVIANHYANGNDAGRATPYQTLVQASTPLGYWRGDAPVTGVAGVAIAANSIYSGGLTKVGSGPLNLGLGNTYRGDTNVNEGTLTLTEAALNDASTVSIAAAAILDLNTAAATDTIKKLYISGTQQAAGVWGAIGSGAAKTSASITGSGFLNVTTGPGAATAYDTWALANGLTAGNKAPGLDPDNDGSTNLREFAFNGNPLSGSDNGRVYVLTQDVNADTINELVLTVAVRDTASLFAGSPSPTLSIDGITYTIQGSTDLSTWTTQVNVLAVPVTTGLPAAGAGYQYRSFSLQGNVGAPVKGFIRARVTLP